MSATRVRGRIEDLVMRVQADFLTTPWLALTLRSAQDRFGMDGVTCEAILDALADAHVLDRSRQGIYVRHFPQTMPRRAVASGRRGSARHAA